MLSSKLKKWLPVYLVITIIFSCIFSYYIFAKGNDSINLWPVSDFIINADTWQYVDWEPFYRDNIEVLTPIYEPEEYGKCIADIETAKTIKTGMLVDDVRKIVGNYNWTYSFYDWGTPKDLKEFCGPSTLFFPLKGNAFLIVYVRYVATFAPSILNYVDSYMIIDGDRNVVCDVHTDFDTASKFSELSYSARIENADYFNCYEYRLYNYLVTEAGLTDKYDLLEIPEPDKNASQKLKESFGPAYEKWKRNNGLIKFDTNKAVQSERVDTIKQISSKYTQTNNVKIYFDGTVSVTATINYSTLGRTPYTFVQYFENEEEYLHAYKINSSETTLTVDKSRVDYIETNEGSEWKNLVRFYSDGSVEVEVTITDSISGENVSSFTEKFESENAYLEKYGNAIIR